METELVLGVCLAVRSGSAQKAQAGFGQLLQKLQGAELLRAAGDCLLAAYRRQQVKLAQSLLVQAQPQLLLLMEDEQLTAEAASLLKRLAFIVCDRQALESLPVLELLVLRFWRSHQAEPKLWNNFWGEWLNLAARMARRGWRRQTGFLLRLFLRALLKADVKQLYSKLLGLQLHFVVYARWDGFSHACAAYKELMSFYLLLLRRAANSSWQADDQQAYLLLVLRSMRDVVAQSARSLMQDDMDIFRLWYQFFWQLAGDNVKRRQELLLLLQLAISYWQGTRPKTSRKQVRYLEDLLQPSLLTEHYTELLQKIC